VKIAALRTHESLHYAEQQPGKLCSEGRLHARALALSVLSSLSWHPQRCSLWCPRKAAGTGPLRLFPAHCGTRPSLQTLAPAACGAWARCGTRRIAARRDPATATDAALERSERVSDSAASYWRLDNPAAPATTASAVSVRGRPVVLYESSRSAAQRGRSARLCAASLLRLDPPSPGADVGAADRIASLGTSRRHGRPRWRLGAV
jgi:hypothetical protein